MPAHVVILGAGFGGLELSTRLADDLPDDVHVTLIDKSDSFVFGFAKLDVLFGRKRLDDVRIPYRGIAKPNVEFRRETITSIDPVTRRVVTDVGTHDADILVVALGADLDPEATPGFIECGREFYSPEGAAALADELPRLAPGRIVLSVLGPLFKCPPAPFEAVFLLHDHLVARGVRDDFRIDLYTPLPSPIPVSKDVSESIVELMHQRDIGFHPASLVTRLDPATRTAHLADGTAIGFDHFFGVPVHRAPEVAVRSGLTEDDGWIAVDHRTFATKFTDVFAVGDITSAPVPRAGVIAEGEAGTVADVLVARFTGGEDAAPYAGAGTCYLEMGGDLVGRVDVNFLGGPSPTATLTPASSAGAAEKRTFGSTRRARWFGAG